MGNGELGVGQLISFPHSPFPTPRSLQLRTLNTFDIAFQVVTPSAGLSVAAAEDRAPAVLLTVVATEAAAPSGLRGGVVLFDCWRRWRVLVFRRRSAEAGEEAGVATNYCGGPSPAGTGFNVTWRLCSGRL